MSQIVWPPWCESSWGASMSEDWQYVALEEIAAAERSAISKPYGSAILKSDYRESGVPVVRGVNLADGVFHDDSFVFIDESVAARMPGAHLKAGDLVVTHRGTVGQVSMIPRSSQFNDYVASTSQVKVRLDESRAVPEFYYYYFSSPQGRQAILENVSTVGVPGLVQPVATVKRLTVPAPPKSLQIAIAEVLGALDDKIAANTRCAALIDSLASTIVQRALQTSSPKQLIEIAELTMGSSPKGTTLNKAGVGTVFYQGIRDFGLRYPSNRVWSTDPVRMAEPMDTLLSVRAPVGQTNLATEPTCIGRGIAAVRSRTRSPYVLFHELRLATDAWAPFDSEGTVFGSINKKQLESVLLPTVPQECRDNLESKLESMESLLNSALTENNVLVSIRDDILPQLMSGKLKVKDSEKVVEGAV